MIIKHLPHSFENIMTPKFLLYAWIDLKINKNYFSSEKYKKYLRKSWFKKASILISKSQFKYKKTLDVTSFSFVKNKIIENAILIFINSSLKRENLNIHSSLTECVRKLIQ
jgi:hypothetical protein